MLEHRCPENITRMFDDPATIGEGRRLAIDWVKKVFAEIPVGETILIPDAATGVLMRFVKQPRPQ